MDESAAEEISFFAHKIDGSANGLFPVLNDGVVVDAPPDVTEGAARSPGEFVSRYRGIVSYAFGEDYLGTRIAVIPNYSHKKRKVCLLRHLG